MESGKTVEKGKGLPFQHSWTDDNWKIEWTLGRIICKIRHSQNVM